MRGTINRYLTEKHFGFIMPDRGMEQVFFHLSVFDPGEGPPPITGESVEYELNEGSKAVSVYRFSTPSHHTGVVKSYDPVKGYGFITTADGQFYLHKSEVLGSMIPSTGSKVSFYTTTTTVPGKSPRACYVAVL
jgi:cold shock CspA family protein